MAAGNASDHRLYHSIRWASYGNLAVQALTFGATLALARLLSPADFGLAAIAISVAAFAQLLTDLGLNSALIQTDRVDAGVVQTSIWINVVSGLCLTFLGWLLSYPLAAVYGRPEIGFLLRVASLGFTLSIGATHIGLLERAMRFRAVALVETVAYLVGYGSAVSLAALGHGAVCIVLGPVFTAATLSLVLWTQYPILPRVRTSRQSVMMIMRRGGGPTVFNVMNYWARNVDNLSLGMVVSPAQLGFYSRAYNFMMAPVIQVTGGVSRAMLPALAAHRRQSGRLADPYLSSVSLAAAVMFPAGILMACSSPNLVLVLLGSRWQPMVPMLTLLALAIPAQVLTGTSGAVYQAAGRNADLVRRGFVSSAATVVAILAGLPWGALGVCVTFLIRAYLLLPYNQRIPFEIAGVGWRAVGARLRGPLCGCAAMAAAALGLRATSPTPLIALFVQVVAGLAAYIVVALLSDRPLAHHVGTAARSVRRKRHPDS